MKTTTVNPKETSSSFTISWYRLVLALIIFICLSYASFASDRRPAFSNEPPVEFKSLSIDRTGKVLQVRWSVEKEQDVSHYIIEQTANGSDYAIVAYVFPFEDQTVQNHYSIKITKKFSGSSRFRIRSVTQSREEQVSEDVR